MRTDTSHEVTQLLDQARDGCPGAAGEASQRVYDLLRGQAAVLLRNERASHTLQATAVVREALIKLIQGDVFAWIYVFQEFVEIINLSMRYVLVSYARTRRSARHGGGVGAATTG